MKGIYSSILVLILLIIPRSGQGAAGWRFLDIPQGARERGMGETGVSLTPSTGTTWWNPAHWAAGDGRVWIESYRWMTDGRGAHGGAVLSCRLGGFGGWYVNHSMTGFEFRDRPGPAQGEFEVHQAAFAVGGGVKFGPHRAVGVAWKGAMETIYGDKTQRINLFDVGVSVGALPATFGAAIRNWSPARDDGGSAPTSAQFGASRSLFWNDWSAVGAVEVTLQRDYQPRLNIGAEAAFNQRMFLRGGMLVGSDSRRFTGGLGVKYNRLIADFAYAPFSNYLGDGWIISVSLKL